MPDKNPPDYRWENPPEDHSAERLPAMEAPIGGWAKFIITAYGPTGLISVGQGAINPLIALSALELGASISLAALITGIVGLGTMIGDLPASWVATKLGEKRALAFACIWTAAWLMVAFFAANLPIFCLAVFCIGLSTSVFGLARHAYLTEAAPAHTRARVMSAMGGAQRFGLFLGPLAAAAVITWWNLAAAYAFAAVMCLFAGVVTLALPDLPSDVIARRSTGEQPKLGSVLRSHLRVYAVLGSSAMLLSIMRAARTTILPLWCASLGMDPVVTSQVFAVSLGVDMFVFFLGGYIMDRFGRRFVAVPCLIMVGLGMIGLLFTSDFWTVLIAAVVLGIGDGLKAGLNSTLGADASPDIGRTQFLAGWRFMGDGGTMVGPTLISGLTAVGGLPVAIGVIGAGAICSSAWVNHSITWLGRYRENRARDEELR